MKAIAIPKTAWIRSAHVDFLKEGLFKGAMAAIFEMTGEPCNDTSTVAATLQALLSTSLPKTKIVRFTGSLTDGDTRFALLLKSLVDYGYQVQFESEGTMIYSWMQFTHWHIVKTKGPIVMTCCDEIWYSPALVEGEKIKDVTFPLFQDGVRRTYLYLARNYPINVIEEFFCVSERPWCLL